MVLERGAMVQVRHGALHRHRHHGGVDALGGRERAPCARRLHERAEGPVQQLLRVEEAAAQVLQLDGQLDEVGGAEQLALVDGVGDEDLRLVWAGALPELAPSAVAFNAGNV